MIIIKDAVSGTYPLLNQGGIDPHTIQNVRSMDARIERSSLELLMNIDMQWRKLRRLSYVLTWAGEQQAINNTGYYGKDHKLGKDKLHKVSHQDTSLGSVDSRVHLWINRLRRKVLDAVEVSRILGESPNEAVNRALAVFPKPNGIISPRVLPRAASYKEAKRRDSADSEENDDIVDTTPLSFMDEDEFNAIVDDYKSEYIPRWRDPRYQLDQTYSDIEGGSGQVVYPWELENEVTEDFVATVRNGESDAANAKGITDFVWIAIIDKKTDECCLMRSGLTTLEIADKLESGELDREECAANTPPAHFNCRCKLAPATDELPDIPDTGEEFESWMFPE